MTITPPYFIQKQGSVGRTLVRHCSTKVEPTQHAAISKPLAVIPVQAGIHKAVQTTTAHGFRLKATGMTGWGKIEKTVGRTLVRHCSTEVEPTQRTVISNSQGFRLIARKMTEWLKSAKLVGRTSVRQCSTEVEPTLWRVQAGFTLLEMILVLFLIGLMASATLMLTEGVEDQAKYDATKLRMEMMRKAIVGDPSRTVNGGPEISGFVADMGRLPGCVAELLESGDEILPATDPKTYDSLCGSSVITAWHPDASTGLSFGWRGPYIQVLPERTGILRFRDGYGNSDVSDAENSGWLWRLGHTTDASNAEARIQSAGFKPLFTDGDEYPSGAISSVPPLIYQRDHLVDLDNWSGRILFINSASVAKPAVTADLILRLHYPDASGGTSFFNSDSFILDASNAVPANDSRYSVEIRFSGSKFVPWGIRSVEVLCNLDDSVFNGTCPSGVTSPDTFRSLTLLPYAQSSTFNFIWDIQ